MIRATKELKVKQLDLVDGVLYSLNNIDDDIMDSRTEFLIGSITKIFTAIMLVLLHDQGIVDIHAPLSNYLTSEHDDFSQITIFNVLRHEAGLKRMPEVHDHLKYKNVSQIYAKYSGDSYLTLPVGKKSYSNWGYILLGKVIEDVTGLSCQAAYRKYITGPLRMAHTRFGNVELHRYKNGNPLSEEDENEVYFASSAGGLHSTVTDMIKFGVGVYRLLGADGSAVYQTIHGEMEGDLWLLKHVGSIPGSRSLFRGEYDPRTLKLVNIRVATNAIEGAIRY